MWSTAIVLMPLARGVVSESSVRLSDCQTNITALETSRVRIPNLPEVTNGEPAVLHELQHTRHAIASPSPPRPPSPPFLQADVEDDAAPAKRPTRKFKNLDKPWEDDSVDHWKQHSQGFTQCGNAGHGGRKIHVPPSGAWWLRAGSRPAGAPVGAAGTPVQPYALCPWRAGTSPSPRRT